LYPKFSSLSTEVTTEGGANIGPLSFLVTVIGISISLYISGVFLS
jgi:hypothetical protein